MSEEAGPSRKRAKVDECDVIDLTGDDDDVAPPAPPSRAGEAAPPAALAPPPPSPSVAKNSKPDTEDADSLPPYCPPLALFRVRGVPAWANVGFLGARLGDLVVGRIAWALISNYMIDGPWLVSACPALAAVPEVVVVHGSRGPGPAEIIAQTLPGAVIHAPHMPAYGTHHSKAFLLHYEGRGMRVIVHTANLIYCDCNNKTQAVWHQDFGLKDGASLTSSAFERDLAAYVAALRLPAAAAARAAHLISLHDFSPSRAHLIPSVPSPDGEFTGPRMASYGHLKLRQALDGEPFDPKFAGAPILAQFSSVGNLSVKWLQAFADSLSGGRVRGGGALGPPRAGLKDLRLVWPTVQEVRDSLEGWWAGGSIPGPHQNVTKDFLVERYCRFGGAPVGRQRAMPHIKSYLRFAGEEVAWMCVGAHNLSKAAWGEEQSSRVHRCQLFKILSYELAVLLTPSLELKYRKSRWFGFSCTDLTRNGAPMAGAERATAVRFIQWQRGRPQEASVVDGIVTAPLPVPYELPPVGYGHGDEPWSVGVPREGVDALGAPFPGLGMAYGAVDSMEWAEVLGVVEEEEAG